MIRFEKVSRVYGSAEKPALEDISVEFGRGEFVFLIGASGSGKSTLLRMILREGLPSAGKLTVAGQNLSLMLERRVPEYRRSVGMVFQDFRLLPDKTVYENVAFAMRVTGAKRTHIRPRVMKTLSRVGLDHLAKRYPHEISGGEQQRAAIARAVINKPAILLADEPTGNLDPLASAEVMKVLHWINDAGTTVIMATHDRAIVDASAHRVVQLHRGRLVRDDSPGRYDPPEGSAAWKALVAEEESSGLRASDPVPTRSEEPVAVFTHLTETVAPAATEPEASAETDPVGTGPADTDPDEPDTDTVEALAVKEPEASTQAAPRLSWLAQAPEPTEPEAPAAPRFGGAAAEEPAEPASKAPAARPVPRPRASAVEAGYAEARRTEEQLSASAKRRLFGRRRSR
ncbi:cell division ATP-binding protein FtsE [Nesterenkonia alba]|uniref:cell division ATP-binding protein FtsE n=1 Tax=Nesterenkonia alba TaxID=515814 RepID=UPI0003B710E4|nr:cell division ATP-binding protein FtsE [Nesterenkonia alba]